MTKLRYIDVAACPNFTGLALFEAGEHFGAKELIRFVLGIENSYEKQKVQEKLS
jgi:hypothetical protein